MLFTMTGCSKIDELPEEMLTEILVRLPVKYILRCRSVQKSWYHLVQTPMFINYHLNYVHHVRFRTDNDNSRYLLSENTISRALTICYDDINFENYCTVRNLPALRGSSWYAQSYGLICLSNAVNKGHCKFLKQTCTYPRDIYLCNPLVQRCKILPASSMPCGLHGWSALAFGFVPEVNDYVVVQIGKYNCSSSVMIHVYSLKSRSWKNIVQDDILIDYIDAHQSVFVNGLAFWIAFNNEGDAVIICFDAKTDMLRKIWLPLSLDVHKDDLNIIHSIHPFDQSIAYFIHENPRWAFDMWILKDGLRNEHSWEKKTGIYSTRKYVMGNVFGVRNNGELILAKLFKLVSYNLENHVASDFVVGFDRSLTPCLVIRPFVESLVLLDI